MARLLGKAGEEAPAQVLPLVSAEDLLESPVEPVDWIMPGWAWPDIHLLAAPGGTAKSFYTFSVALALASGSPILGQWSAGRTARVLVIQEEDPPDLSRLRIQRLCAGMGLGPEDLGDRLKFTPFRSGFFFGDPTFCARLAKTIGEFEPDLVMIDSVSKIGDIADPNKVPDVRAFFRDRIEPLVRDYGCGVALVHHTNKLAHQLKPTVDTIATITGNKAFSDSCDSVGIIQGVPGARDSRQFNFVKTRRYAKPNPFRFQFMDLWGEGPPETRPVRLMFEGFVSVDECQTEPGRPDMLRVVQFLKDNPGRKFSRPRLTETLGVSKDTILRARECDGVHHEPGRGGKNQGVFWAEANETDK